ncbi:MAG: large subunit ribosomal protein [Thermomicrobiales bacterium]|jgi:large subunit ribosomal protein L6|nr:large subunit ribosomal protein [Thermomicrobiales bacterium]MEA2595673.1 large subunit ribosomal protein [Thermomicrobiales bacterium]
MSRIGRKPIPLPATVDVVIDQGNVVTVKGPRGQLAATFAPSIVLERENGSLNVSRPDDSRQNRSLHGLTRTLLSNMVTGVTEGFRKNLEIQGVGYRAAMDGKTLVLSVGYSHPVRMTPPDGVTYTLDGLTKVAVLGSDKQLVGEEAARIRRVRPPEPYKGKGIRYEGEQVRRKAGKTGKAK